MEEKNLSLDDKNPQKEEEVMTQSKENNDFTEMALFTKATNMFAADAGISAIVGGVFGFIVGMMFPEYVETPTTLLIYTGAFIGALISFYIAYLLYRTTKAIKAVVYLALVALIFTVIGYYTDMGLRGEYIWLSLSTFISYAIGFFVAQKNVSFPELRGAWLKTFMVIGYILLLLSVVKFITLLIN